MSETEAELVFVDDLRHGAWLLDGIKGFAENVGSIIPHGFEAYARLFHPASLDGLPVSWSEIARANGTTMHAEAQFEAVARADPWHEHRPGLWDMPPEVGHLPGTTFSDSHDLAGPLATVLGASTHSPDEVWFCVWEGWGGLKHPEIDARLQLPNRAFWLARGPVTATRRGFDAIGALGPSIWWPDDRAWCVATEIDFRWTYVAGSRELIDELVADPRFEALHATITDGVRIDSDQTNR